MQNLLDEIHAFADDVDLLVEQVNKILASNGRERMELALELHRHLEKACERYVDLDQKSLRLGRTDRPILATAKDTIRWCYTRLVKDVFEVPSPEAERVVGTLIEKLDPPLEPVAFLTLATNESDEDETGFEGGWNYRVRETQEEDGTPHYEIVEVYYDKEGNPTAWGDAGPPQGSSLAELRDDLEAMFAALDKPVCLPDELFGE